MNKIIFFFVFLLLIPVALAAQAQENINIDVGLDILYPPYEYILIGEPFDLNVIVINISTGLQKTNADTTCKVNLFYHNGSLLNEDDLTYANGQFNIELGAGNFSTEDTYSFQILCNTSTKGGYAYSPYKVTRTGNNDSPTDTTSGIVVLIFALTIVLGLFLLPFFKRFTENEILNTTLNSCCWILSLFFLSLTTAMVSTIVETSNIGLTYEILHYLWYINWFIYLFMLFVIFRYLLRMLRLIRDNAKLKRTGGYDE